MVERARANGRKWQPEVLDEHESLVLVDPHVEPPPELNPTLHHVFVLDHERVVEVRDYPDRATALAALARLRSLW